MKQTIVVINSADYTDNVQSNETFLQLAKQRGEVLQLEEFARRYNYEEIDFNNTYIRFIEAELEVVSCK